MLNKFKNDFKLNNNNMTFFVAHSSIDEKHSAEVKAIMEKVIKTDEDKKKIKEVANVTLYLTGKLLEESLNEYMRSKNKKK
jgi:pyrroloquinoline quinone (PQQ) biosynthesis protein C